MNNSITMTCYDGFWQVDYVIANGKRCGCLRFDQDELGSLAMTITLEGLQKEAGCGVRVMAGIEPPKSTVQHEIGFDTEAHTAAIIRQQEEGV